MSKFVIYQTLPRLFGNFKTENKVFGSLNDNGCGKFNSYTNKALNEIKNLGVTHIWYTGIIEHATQTDYSSFGIKTDYHTIVKGKAGSAYAIKDYYDVDPDLAVSVPNRMKEFENLVQRTHRNGLKVIIDFVPNHLARQYNSDAKPEGVSDPGENDNKDISFHPQHNFYYLPGQHFNPAFNIGDYVEYPAKATGNDQFTASPSINDWFETVKLNYGVDYQNGGNKSFDPVPDTWIKMTDILLFWASKKVDGFRCDMAEMVPVEFWHYAIAKVKKQYPEIIFIAEIYNPDQYRNYIFHGGFDYLYDKVGLYDTLRNIMVYNHSASLITHNWQSLHGIEDKMLNFLENHDEQRIASAFFASSAEVARPAMIVASCLNTAPVMIYNGQEIGEQGMDAEGFSGLDGRTTIFDYWGVATLQQWTNDGKFDGGYLSVNQHRLRQFYQRLLTVSMQEVAIRKGIMYDLQYANFENPDFDTNKQFCWLRKQLDDIILIVVSFAEENKKVKINIPAECLLYIGIPEQSVFSAIDLLDDNYEMPVTLSSRNKISIEVPAKSGRIIKLNQVYQFE